MLPVAPDDGRARVRLSVAMIVKNEAMLLSECLASAEGFADEICVMDTGSSDDSLAIAAQGGAKVSSFPWRDDFAEARNRSLEMCTGEWIFVLDADERIAAEDHAALRALIEQPNVAAYRFTTRNYTNNGAIGGFVSTVPGAPLARGFAGWFPSIKIRLFPNNLGIRFTGPLHELVNRSVEAARLPIANTEIAVHHYPLLKSKEVLEAKRRMYVRLGKAKVQQQPEDARAHGELADQLAELQDYGAAAQAYRNALRLDPGNAERLKDLGACLHLLGRNEEAEKAIRLAIQRESGLADAWRNLGVVLGAREAWAEATAALEEAVRLAPGNLDLRRCLDVARARCNTGE